MVFMWIPSVRCQSFVAALPPFFNDTSASGIESFLHESALLPKEQHLIRQALVSSDRSQHIHFRVRVYGKLFLDARVILNYFPQQRAGFLSGYLVTNPPVHLSSSPDPFWVEWNQRCLAVTPDTSGSSVYFRSEGHFIFSRDFASYNRDTLISFPLFLPDAVSRSGADYGVVVADSNDQNLPGFASLYLPAPVPLKVSKDSIFLQNKYVYISDVSGRKISVSGLPLKNYNVQRDDFLFECLQVLYHIYQFRSYLDSLGFMALHPQPIAADPHGTAADQSSYIPDYLIFGDGGVDDAEDAEVIVHEYGHALIESASPGTNIGFERKSADEGSCDYWASGYTFQLNAYKPEVVFPWDGHNEFWKGRIINSTATYPAGIVNNSIHQTGQLWSSTLLQISNIIGRRAMDQLLLESYFSFAPNLSFAQMAQIVIKTDSLLHGGQYHFTLCHLFTIRGFINGNCYNSLISPVEWSPLMHYAAGSIFLSDLPEDVYQANVYDVQGRIVHSFEFKGVSGQFPCALTPGIYIISLNGAGGNLYYGKWLVTE